jgi:hypothetical protein
MMIMLYPVYTQVTTMAIAHSTRDGDKKSTVFITDSKGERFGEKRNPHMIAAITPGTAYGAK